MTERVTKQITEKLLIVYRAGLEDMDKKPYLPSVSVCEVASQILAIDGLEVRADEQVLPRMCRISMHSPTHCVQDMLNAGFVKVVK